MTPGRSAGGATRTSGSTSVPPPSAASRPAPAAGRPAPTDAVRSPLEWVERAAVLTAARLAEHPVVVPMADIALRTQVVASRLYHRATVVLWHACGVATFDEMSTLGEQLASLRYRVPSALREPGSDPR